MRLIRIANRIRQSMSQNYKENGPYVFFTGKSRNSPPTYCINRIGTDKFIFVKFHSKRKLTTILQKMPTDDLIDAYIAVSSSVTDRDLAMSKITQNGINLVALIFLRNLNLLYWLNSNEIDLTEMPYQVCISEKKTLNKQKLYKRLVGREKMNHATFETLFGEIESGQIDELDQFQHHKWQVIIHEKAKVSSDEVKDTLDGIERKLGHFKNQLAYGKVVVLNTIKGSALANYQPKSDLIQLRAKALGKRDFIQEILHELGHRNWYKSLDSETQKQIRTKFMILSMGGVTSKEMGLEIGTIISVEDVGEEYEVVDIGYPYTSIQILSVKNKRREKQVGKRGKIKNTVLASGSFQWEGKKEVKRSGYFFTSHSMKNVEEMYAEMFSQWLLGNLSGEAKEWFEELH